MNAQFMQNPISRYPEHPLPHAPVYSPITSGKLIFY